MDRYRVVTLTRRASDVRGIRTAVTIGAAFGATWVASLTASPQGVSLLYPPAAVVFSAALVFGVRHGLVAAVATAASAMVLVEPPIDVIATAEVRLVPLLGYILLAGWLRTRRDRIGAPHETAILWGAWVVGSAIAACGVILGATMTGELSAAAWPIAESVFLAHLTALTCLTPVVLAVARPEPVTPTAGRRRRGGWPMTSVGVIAAATAQLALTGRAAPIALVAIAAVAFGAIGTSQGQVALPPLLATAVTVVSLADGTASHRDALIAQAALVAGAALITAVHVFAAETERVTAIATEAHAIADAARSAAETEHENLIAVIEAVDEGVFVLGCDRTVAHLNREASRLLGSAVGEVPGGDSRWIDIDGSPLPTHRLPSARALAGEEVSDLRIGRLDAGGVQWLDVTSRIIAHEDNATTTVFTLRDANDEVAASRLTSGETSVLRHQATHDALTGLVNQQGLQELLDDAHRRGQTIGLVFIDLDGFKAVNDRLGHSVGDELLVAVSLRLRNIARDEDVVARVGGDEFVVLCPLSDSGRAELQLQTIASRFIDGVGGAHPTNAGEVVVGATLGWAVDVGGRDPHAALHRADMAMLARKRSRRTDGRRGPRVRAQALAEGSCPPPSAGFTVFIVDDDASMRLLAARVLELEDPTITVVGEADGATAVAEILARRPDMVLCDVMMPQVSGPQVVREVRAQIPHQPFVFWSAATRSILDQAALDLDVAWITKELTNGLAAALRATLEDGRSQPVC